MPSATDTAQRIRTAILQLRVAAIHDGDRRRMDSARHLEQQFADITDPQELHATAREALRLYGGGMGSFHDTATTQMADAVDGLYEALRQAV